MINVRDFGAVGDGVTDDRYAIQRALDAGAGGTVWADTGTYLVGQGAGAWCLNVPAATTFVGENSLGSVVLLQAPGIAANVRLLQAAGPGIVISTLVLDGNADNQTPDEHRAGVFALGAINLHIEDVIARNFTGDGLYISIGSHDAQILRCTCSGNHRDGLVFGGGTHGGLVDECTLTANAVQQFDTEPGPGFHVDGLTVTRCTIGAGRGDYAMTVSGSGASSRSTGWTISHNTFDGSLEIVWASDITIANNKSTNSTNKPSIQVYRACDRINIRYNELALSPTTTGNPADAVITVSGTGLGQMPDDVVIERNRLSSSAGPAHGVHVTCAGTVMVLSNSIIGAGIADHYAAGVYARTTVTGAPVVAVVVHGNQISNWGAFGVALAGNGDAVLQMASVTDNIFNDNTGRTQAMAAMSLPVALDVRAGLNTLLGGCTVEHAVPPAGRSVTALGVARWLVV